VEGGRPREKKDLDQCCSLVKFPNTKGQQKLLGIHPKYNGFQSNYLGGVN